MPNNPLESTSNDLGVLPRPPASLEDISVVLAEEDRLNTDLMLRYSYATRGDAGWSVTPTIKAASTTDKNLFEVNGQAFLPIYPAGNLDISFKVKIPALKVSAGSVINREDYLYLVGIACEVGAEQDPVLGQLEFTYRDENESNEVAIRQMVGENSRRLRAYIISILSPEILTPDIVKTIFAIPATDQVPAHHRFTVIKKGEVGFPISDYYVFAIDENWVASKSYPMFSGYIDILPICKIQRTANYVEGGYQNDEETQIIDLILDSNTSQEDINAIIWKRFADITTGYSRNYKKTAQNFTLGAIPANTTAPGEAAIASNGTNLLANGQRIPFIDQPIIDNISVSKVAAENDGNDRALVPIPLRQTAPYGTFFAEDLSQHRIFSLNGNDESRLGRFTRLGQAGMLTWIAGDQSTIKPGNACFIVPAISYPGGSGFRLGYRVVEKVWINGQLVDGRNILEGGISDLEAYAEPFGNQQFFVVTARERSGILYIYQDVIVQSDAQGILAAPEASGGCFAFIEGITGRLDVPVYRVQRPNSPYRALCYYAPKAGENWQFLLSYPPYQGRGELDAALIENAEIISEPIFIAHTQGGGNSVYRGEATFRFSPIAKYLPQVKAGIQPYELHGPIYQALESYPGPLTMRALPLTAAPGLAMPMLGQKLSLRIEATHQMEERSLRGRLMSNGETLGYRLPNLNHDFPFQGVVAFAIRKDRDVRLLVITHNNIGGTSVVCDSSRNTAFDLFKIL